MSAISQDTSPLYLGLDLSTQQLKAILISSDLHVVAEAKVDFDGDFGGAYGVQKGVLSREAEGEVFAPVAMWLEAIDLVCQRLCDQDAPLSRVRGISGSCQQHGSVYWSDQASSLLDKLQREFEGGGVDTQTATPTTTTALVTALSPDAFASPTAPNWQDHSTQRECDLFNQTLGGRQALADATGSAAHHRFTGPQIKRLKHKHPEVYRKTKHISLVSSFLASIFAGRLAPLDISDVCGMNLWDIQNSDWNEELLVETVEDDSPEAVETLREKLGRVEFDGGASIGCISPYFVQKYGFSRGCRVTPFTGDNPGTILSLPLRPLDAIVSLGTSTTFLMVTPYYKPDAGYHFFNHPTTPGQYMFMLCYKNGGLAREKIRDGILDTGANASGKEPWSAFNAAIASSNPLSIENGRAKLGLYFPLPEIVPGVRAGTWRYTCKEEDGSDLQAVAANQAWSAEVDARTIVESQALSMRLRSQALVHSPTEGVPAQPRRVYLVGGGSLNPAIAEVMGEVLGGVEGVYRLDVGGNACALGGAYKALWALERGDGETFDDLIGKRWKEEGAIQKVHNGYQADVFDQYGKILHAYEAMEGDVMKTT